MRFGNMMAATLAIFSLTLGGCGAGGGGAAPVQGGKAPITLSMSTAISGTTAEGTVFLAGLASPTAFGLDLVVAKPAGSGIATETQSGGAAQALAPALHPDGATITLASGSGFGSGEIMRINFANLPAGAAPGDFGVRLTTIVDGFGVPIQ